METSTFAKNRLLAWQLVQDRTELRLRKRNCGAKGLCRPCAPSLNQYRSNRLGNPVKFAVRNVPWELRVWFAFFGQSLSEIGKSARVGLLRAGSG